MAPWDPEAAGLLSFQPSTRENSNRPNVDATEPRTAAICSSLPVQTRDSDALRALVGRGRYQVHLGMAV